MKKIIQTLLFTFFVAAGMTSISCFSAGSIVEDYSKSPVRASATGEGRKSYSFVYKGKNYVLIKNADGKFQAVESPESSKIVIPQMPPMPEGVR